MQFSTCQLQLFVEALTSALDSAFFTRSSTIRVAFCGQRHLLPGETKVCLCLFPGNCAKMVQQENSGDKEVQGKSNDWRLLRNFLYRTTAFQLLEDYGYSEPTRSWMGCSTTPESIATTSTIVILKCPQWVKKFKVHLQP